MPPRRGRRAPEAAPAAAPARDAAAVASDAVAAFRLQEAAVAALSRRAEAARAAADALDEELEQAQAALDTARTKARRAAGAARRGGGAAALATHITALPPDIVVELAMLLDPRSRVAMACTCSLFRAALTAEPTVVAWDTVDVARDQLFGAKGAVLPAFNALSAHSGDVRTLQLSKLDLKRDHKLIADTIVPGLTRLSCLHLSLGHTFFRNGPQVVFAAVGKACPSLRAIVLDRAAATRRGYGRHVRRGWGGEFHAFREQMLDAASIEALGSGLTRLTGLSVIDVAAGSSLTRLLPRTPALRELRVSDTLPALPAGALPALTKIEGENLRSIQPSADELGWLNTVTAASLTARSDTRALNTLARSLTRVVTAELNVSGWSQAFSIPGLSALRSLRDCTVARVGSERYWGTSALDLASCVGAQALASLCLRRVGNVTALAVPQPMPQLASLTLDGLTTAFTWPPLAALPALTRLALLSIAPPQIPNKLNIMPLVTATASRLRVLKLAGFELTAFSTAADDVPNDAAAQAAMAAFNDAAATHARLEREIGALRAEESRMQRDLSDASFRTQHALYPREDVGVDADTREAAQAEVQAAENALQAVRERIAAVGYDPLAKGRAETALRGELVRVVVAAVPQALPSLRVFHSHTGGVGGKMMEDAIAAQTGKEVTRGSRDACASCGG